jgi:hypothetical protein
MYIILCVKNPLFWDANPWEWYVGTSFLEEHADILMVEVSLTMQLEVTCPS